VEFDPYWRGRLARALSRILKPTVSRADAVDALLSLDRRLLLALDHALRLHEWHVESDSAARDSIRLLPANAHEAERAAYLFTAACDADGFVREQALGEFAGCPGPLAMAAALIRADDWVPQVRAAGKLLLARLSGAASGAALFENFEILLGMRERRRFSQEVWPELVEPVLRLPENARRRWQATQQRLPAVRRFACELVADSDPERIPDVCRLAAGDADPALARWALNTSFRLLSTSDARTLASETLRSHPHGSVRAAALHALASNDASASKDAVEAALIDRSRSVRSAAAYLLRKWFDADPAEHWRAALSAHDPRRRVIAVQALADVAQPADAQQLLPWLGHHTGKIRAAALRGLESAKFAQVVELATLALADANATVLREAIGILHRSAGALTVDLLLCARANAANRRAQTLLTQSARLLDKWDGLETYLVCYAESDPVGRRTIQDELEIWRRSAWKRFTPLSAASRVRIEKQLVTLSDELPTRLANEFKHIVAHA